MTAQLPQTPEGFTVCTPLSIPAPVLYFNNLPSLVLFQKMKVFGVYRIELISETVADALSSITFR